jgi:hypothetical protein
MKSSAARMGTEEPLDQWEAVDAVSLLLMAAGAGKSDCGARHVACMEG